MIYEAGGVVTLHFADDVADRPVAISQFEAALLARALLVAASQTLESPLSLANGDLVVDGSVEIKDHKVGFLASTGSPVVILEVANGIPLTFHTKASRAKEMGNQLLAAGQQAEGKS